MDSQTVTLVVALVALGLSLVNTVVQVQTYRRDRVELRVDVSWAMPTYAGTVGPTMVTVTGTNVGRQPVGINGMGLNTKDGHSIPLTESQPGHTMPAVLQPGEHRTMWVESDKLAAVLHENNARLRSAEVHGPGGQRWRTKKLGGIGKLGA